jgi:hypothetical protein
MSHANDGKFDVHDISWYNLDKRIIYILRSFRLIR